MSRSLKFLTLALHCCGLNKFLIEYIDEQPLVDGSQLRMFPFDKETCNRFYQLAVALESFIGVRSAFDPEIDGSISGYEVMMFVKGHFEEDEVRVAISYLQELSQNNPVHAEEALQFIGKLESWTLARHQHETMGCF